MNDKIRCHFRSRIGEAKFRQLIRCFALDFTATSTAQLTDISVQSVNTIYLKIRQRIAQCCELESPFQGAVEVDESYFGAQRVRGRYIRKLFQIALKFILTDGAAMTDWSISVLISTSGFIMVTTSLPVANGISTVSNFSGVLQKDVWRSSMASLNILFICI